MGKTFRDVLQGKAHRGVIPMEEAQFHYRYVDPDYQKNLKHEAKKAQRHESKRVIKEWLE